ncbi:MAG TPA: transcription elongation factor GreA [Candidatus Paceibacterota bacterium]|nr:transcription elongation factor GreA [Candidatus Paceibacterota bacterium]
MNTDTHYLTSEKFDELTRELEELRTVRRKEVAEELEYSKSLGDLSENAEYHQARESQMNLEERISKLEILLKHATIIAEGHKPTTDIVSIGNKVTVTKEGDGTQQAYIIVGSEEADISQNKLSIDSPLAAAMIGKKKGETFSVRMPKGEMVYKITRID